MPFFKNLLKNVNRWLWPLVFLTGHFLFFLTGHVLALLQFHFWWINYPVACFWIIVALKNGSTFYMDYFA